MKAAAEVVVRRVCVVNDLDENLPDGDVRRNGEGDAAGVGDAFSYNDTVSGLNVAACLEPDGDGSNERKY